MEFLLIKAYRGNHSGSYSDEGDICPSHEEFIYKMRRFSSFGDRPHDKGLAAPHITGRKNAFFGSHLVQAGLNISPLIKVKLKLS